MNHSSNIRFYERAQIDTDRWDRFIKNSPQYRLYALSTWLDHLSPGWGALINTDYSIAMPLPCKRKYGIAYLAQPRFTQQLGLYAHQPVTSQTRKAFFDQAIALYPFAEIQLNTPAEEEYSAARENYVLQLSAPYTTIRTRYSKNLVNNSLKPAARHHLVYRTQPNINKAIDTYRQLYQQRLKLDNHCFHRLKALAAVLSQSRNCFTRQVESADGAILAISLFFNDDHRIYNLCSATTGNGRRLNANHFLYDRLIQEFSPSGLVLDFEGSSVPGIAAFYKKFGATPEYYYFVKWNRLKWPYKIFKK